jgi:hypothetical protein
MTFKSQGLQKFYNKPSDICAPPPIDPLASTLPKKRTGVDIFLRLSLRLFDATMTNPPHPIPVHVQICNTMQIQAKREKSAMLGYR